MKLCQFLLLDLVHDYHLHMKILTILLAAEAIFPTITKTKLGSAFNIRSLLYQSRMMSLGCFFLIFEIPERKEWHFVSSMLFLIQDLILFVGITKLCILLDTHPLKYFLLEQKVGCNFSLKHSNTTCTVFTD